MPRVLSEQEFNDIKQQVLASLPPNLDEQSFTRMAQSSLAGALATAENSPAPLQGSSLSRALSGFWQTVPNPLSLLTGGGDMNVLRDLAINTGLGAVDQAQKARTAPTTSEAIGHGAAAVLPGLGPAAANAGESIATGDIAGGLGQGAGLLAPIAAAEGGRALLQKITQMNPGLSDDVKYTIQRKLGIDPTESDRLSLEATKARLQAARAKSRQMGLPPLTKAMRDARTAAPPIDAAGRELGGVAGPERRVTSAGPPEGVLERRAANAKLAQTGGRKAAAATSPAETASAPQSPAAPASASATAATPPATAAGTSAVDQLKSVGLDQAEVDQALRWLKAGIPEEQIVKRLNATRALLGGKPSLKNLPNLQQALDEVRHR